MTDLPAPQTIEAAEEAFTNEAKRASDVSEMRERDQRETERLRRWDRTLGPGTASYNTAEWA